MGEQILQLQTESETLRGGDTRLRAQRAATEARATQSIRPKRAKEVKAQGPHSEVHRLKVMQDSGLTKSHLLDNLMQSNVLAAEQLNSFMQLAEQTPPNRSVDGEAEYVGCQR